MENVLFENRILRHLPQFHLRLSQTLSGKMAFAVCVAEGEIFRVGQACRIKLEYLE